VHDSGTVELRVQISPDGAVKQVEVVSGHPILAKAAVDAMAQWKFQPQLRNGKPAEAETLLDFVFAGPGHVSVPGFAVPVPAGPDDKVKVTPAALIHSVPPRYPSKAMKKRISGTVRVYGQITKEGEVEDLEALSGDPLLIPAALDAIRQWRYKPTLVDGVPAQVDTCIEVRFELRTE